MEWMDSGVFLMGHFIIVISNSIYIYGKFMSFGEFKRKCAAITKTNLLMYEGVLKP